MLFPRPLTVDSGIDIHRLDDLWEDRVLAQYLDGDLDREEAIEHVGRTKLERAEREREIVARDVDWGLNA